MGRKKYEEWLEPHNLLRIQGWARDGLSEEQISHNMGITYKTLWEWKKKYSNISNVLKINKDIADRQIENALFKAAKDGNTTAMIFWLKNRKRKEWRDKQDVNLTGEVKYTNSELSDKELLLKLEELKKKKK